MKIAVIVGIMLGVTLGVIANYYLSLVEFIYIWASIVLIGLLYAYYLLRKGGK